MRLAVRKQMKLFKKNIFTYILAISFFIYGILVGKYEIFPHDVIDENVELVKNMGLDIKETLNQSPPIAPLLPSYDPFSFIAYGDNPYVHENDVQKVISPLISSINNRNTNLIIHVGDTFGGQPCTDTMLDLQLEIMNSLNAPVLYTPGDNEWRDCVDLAKGEDHNLERLAYIRKTYFSDQKTLGMHPTFVENQSTRGYPENARLMMKNIAFITAHVVGSSNNFDPMSKKNTEEFFERDEANIEWITKSFKKYKSADAFVVAIHADMSTPPAPPFLKFSQALYELSNKYNKPILILFGDSHVFRTFQPHKEKYPLLHAIEVFGYPDVKAIEIEVDLSERVPFKVINIIE